MKGLILKFKGHVKNILSELLKEIDNKNLYFYLNYWESYFDDIDESEYDFNTLKDISSDMIKEKIFDDTLKVSPEFMELFVYDKISNTYNTISTYEDFLKSDCILSIVSYDYNNIEICSKYDNILLSIMNNIKRLELEDTKIVILKNIHPKASLKAWKSINDIPLYIDDQEITTIPKVS